MAMTKMRAPAHFRGIIQGSTGKHYGAKPNGPVEVDTDDVDHLLEQGFTAYPIPLTNDMSNVGTVDPHIAGHIWCDEANGGVLKRSSGPVETPPVSPAE